jgi:hypothetical protein
MAAEKTRSFPDLAPCHFRISSAKNRPQPVQVMRCDGWGQSVVDHNSDDGTSPRGSRGSIWTVFESFEGSVDKIPWTAFTSDPAPIASIWRPNSKAAGVRRLCLVAPN